MRRMTLKASCAKMLRMVMGGPFAGISRRAVGMRVVGSAGQRTMIPMAARATLAGSGRLVAVCVVDEAVAVDLGIANDGRNVHVGARRIGAVDGDRARVLAAIGSADRAGDVLARRRDFPVPGAMTPAPLAMVMVSRERWPFASVIRNSPGCRASSRTVMSDSPVRPWASGGVEALVGGGDRLLPAGDRPLGGSVRRGGIARTADLRPAGGAGGERFDAASFGEAARSFSASATVRLVSVARTSA